MPEARWTELSSLAEWLPLCMCNASTAPGEPGPSYKQTNKQAAKPLGYLRSSAGRIAKALPSEPGEESDESGPSSDNRGQIQRKSNAMTTLTSNSVKRSAPSPTGRTPEAKRNAEKLEDSTSSNMGDNTDPRPNTGPLKGNKPPQNTGTLTLTSPKSAGASRPGADNRSTPFADAAKRTRTDQIMGDLPKTLTMGEIIEALRNGQIFDQFE